MDSEDYSEDLDPFAGKKAGAAGGGDRKRRFSDDQIKSLETMFETQSKLEPRVKIQLARELELQPRQVAIWFQNKRARWKSKQLERQYFALKTEYDALKCSFDALNKEKQLLLKQSQKLEELLEREGGDVSFAEEGLKLGEEEQEEKVVCVGHQEEAELLYWGEQAGGGGVERRRCFASEGSPEKSYEWWDFWPLND